MFNFDSVICDFSPSNSIFTPLELEHEIPGTTFKISIELKDENNNDILITDQDPLFDELDCIINGSMLLYKYMDQDDKFVCAFSCGFPQAGESIIEVFHNDNLIREYIIGEPTGIIDLSKSTFNAFNLFVEAGEIRPYLTIGIYDTYGFKISMDYGNNEYYSKIKCVSALGVVETSHTNEKNQIVCNVPKSNTHVVGNYWIGFTYEHSPDNIETLYNTSYTVGPNWKWDSTKSTVNFPSTITKYTLASIKIVNSKDAYGNDNNDNFDNTCKIEILSSNSDVLYAFEYINGNSNREYKFTVPPLPVGATFIPVKLRLCQYGAHSNRCKESGTVVWI